MTAGLSVTNLANAWLNVLRGTTFTGLAGLFVKLHTGDPGANGTANASGETSRKALTLAAASSGSIAATSTLPSWTSWSVGTETITHISLWDASSAGTFYDSIALTASRSPQNGDTLSLASLSIALAALAA